MVENALREREQKKEKSKLPTNLYNRDEIIQGPQVSVLENPYSNLLHLGSMVTSLLRH